MATGDLIKSFDDCINEFKQQVTFAKYKVEVFKEKIVFFQVDTPKFIYKTVRYYGKYIAKQLL